MSANVIAASEGGAVQNEAIDPSRAAAGFARWRRALAEAIGEDPGARLDRPDRKLTMLRIFGSTRRLADLCLKHPAVASEAMVEGASCVLAQTARDIAALAGGAGGPESVYAAFAPLKNRADIAIAVAELSGAWTAAEATAARTDFAERLIETALAWLVRGAVNRGELAVSSEDGAVKGVFALAGGDFAHEDLAPVGPLDFAVVYDDRAFATTGGRMAERAFARLGAEMKEALEGRTGDCALYHSKTPFGAGVGGVGFVESRARAVAQLNDPQQTGLRAWFATARVVAGDRAAGGRFLEDVEETVWRGERREAARGDDPRGAFRAVADVFRFAFGATRPVFRTASARVVFETAAASGNFPRDLATRLIAGEDFAQGLVSRLHMLKGFSGFAGLRADEEGALARLCGFTTSETLIAAFNGLTADARNTLAQICDGPLAEFDRYRSASECADDVDKLEDLGFKDGVKLSGLAETWAALAGAKEGERFAAVAPGLLTAIGETQRPDQAVRLLDDMLRIGDTAAAFAALKTEGRPRSTVVDALGCFGEAVAPLAGRPETIGEFFEERGRETPASGAEWLSRYAPPKGADVSGVAAWRSENIARVALIAASGAMTFDAAADALTSIGTTTLSAVFEAIQARNKWGEGVALHVYQSSINGFPGAPAAVGFIGDGGTTSENEEFAREFVDAVGGLGEGFFAVVPDVSRRPGGATGTLAASAAAFKSYAQSEAVAADQMLLARARVIAGTSAAQEAARKALRAVSANPKRADMVFRDLDRARAQRLRRDRSGSDWDILNAEGGVGDVDLIVGALVYRHVAALPTLREASVECALDALTRGGLLAPPAAETLKSARAFFVRLAALRALARWSDPQREPVRSRFGALIARAAQVDRWQLVRPLIRGYTDEVSRLYAQLVLGRPASTLAAVG